MAISRKPLDPDTALVRLETLCADSEQCTANLLAKLRRWGVSASDASEIVDSLVDRRFVDDRRFAMAYARDKMRFGRWGRAKIRVGLYAKRIPAPLIDEALEALDDDLYSKVCLATLRSRVRSASLPGDYDGRTRLYRFGLQRGFEPALLSELIRSRKPWLEETD
ncbi:MAG: RecX family transcriptional regulator [Clostridium sp.]|nr:RecX family transcriptional regulator [Clostridium sp.]